MQNLHGVGVFCFVLRSDHSGYTALRVCYLAYALIRRLVIRLLYPSSFCYVLSSSFPLGHHTTSARKCHCEPNSYVRAILPVKVALCEKRIVELVLTSNQVEAILGKD